MDLPMAKAAPQFTQEGISEYHLYSLGRRTSIQNNESKQISLLTGTELILGLGGGDIILLAVTLTLCIISFGTGRTNVLTNR